MFKQTGSWFAASALMLFATQSQALPITFEFSAQPYSVGWQGGELNVPAPFDDTFYVAGLPISGSFTIESDTPATSFRINHNGSWITLNGSYDNAVNQLDFIAGGQQFSYDSSRLDASSNAHVIDLPSPANESWYNHDTVGLTINLGAGLFSGEYSHLLTSLSFSRSERDLSVITSSDLLANLTNATNWSAFFSIYDETGDTWYQIHAPVTSLTQVSSVPEPATSALLGMALVLSISAVGRRKRA